MRGDENLKQRVDCIYESEYIGKNLKTYPKYIRDTFIKIS